MRNYLRKFSSKVISSSLEGTFSSAAQICGINSKEKDFSLILNLK